MSTRATLIYDTEKGLHIYQEVLDNTVHIEVAKEAVLIDVEIMPFEQWVSLGLLKENIRVLRAAEHSVQSDGALPSVEEVICPICQSIVRLYDGNRVGMHTPHSNVSEPICKMVGSEITPRR